MSDTMRNRFRMIDSRSQVPEDIALDDIRLLNRSGRSFRDGVDHRDGRPKYRYRNGVICPIGDIELGLWKEIGLELVKNEGSQELFDLLKAWYKNCISWIRTKDELEEYTLGCFSNRLYDNPAWCDYEEFNRTHRPQLALAVKTEAAPMGDIASAHSCIASEAK